MSLSVNKQILDIVKRVKDEAKLAEEKKNKLIEDVQSMARQSIDLFSGCATSRLADICNKTKSALEDYYTTCQTLVAMLDLECRPLLRDNPDAIAVYEVHLLINWLNEESEIKNTFTGQLNGIGLGDMAVVNYHPSIESKMVQKFWEQTFKAMPDSKKAVKDKKDKEAEELRQIKAEEQAAKSVIENAKKTMEALQNKYDHKKDNEKIIELKEKEEERIEKVAEQFEKTAQEKLLKFKNELRTIRDKDIEALKEKISNLRHSKNPDKRKRIKEIKAQIRVMKTEQYLSVQYEKCSEKITSQIDAYRSELKNYVNCRFIETKKTHKEKNPFYNDKSVQIGMSQEEWKVYYEVKYCEPITGSQVVTQLEMFVNRWEILKHLRSLVMRGMIIRDERSREVYFSTAGEYLSFNEHKWEDKGKEMPTPPEVAFKKSDYDASDYVKEKIQK